MAGGQHSWRAAIMKRKPLRTENPTNSVIIREVSPEYIINSMSNNYSSRTIIF